jgi:hypothetical protein
MPLWGSAAAKNAFNASIPPAEAPMPTIGNGLRARSEKSTGAAASSGIPEGVGLYLCQPLFSPRPGRNRLGATDQAGLSIAELVLQLRIGLSGIVVMKAAESQAVVGQEVTVGQIQDRHRPGKMPGESLPDLEIHFRVTG